MIASATAPRAAAYSGAIHALLASSTAARTAEPSASWWRLWYATFTQLPCKLPTSSHPLASDHLMFVCTAQLTILLVMHYTFDMLENRSRPIWPDQVPPPALVPMPSPRVRACLPPMPLRASDPLAPQSSALLNDVPPPWEGFTGSRELVAI